MKSVLLFLFIFSISFSAFAQTNKYNIVLFGSTIGTGSGVLTKLSNGQTNYKLVTQASAKVMFKERTSLTDIEMNYLGNVLQSCKLKRESDGEYQNVQISYENGKHYFIENGKKVLVAKPVTFTTTQLFFKEPSGIKEIYVERLNQFVPLTKEEDGLYKLAVDGGDNYYRYEKGILVEYRLKKGVNVYIYKV
jgi:hypothetical protein